MGGLERVVQRLIDGHIQGELWVNGSFVTQKMNPEDVDLVLRVLAEVYDQGTVEQKQAIDWLETNLKGSHLCHSFVFMEWPEGHPNYSFGEHMYSYWMKQFGFSRGEEVKGIAVVTLPGGVL